MPTFSHITDGEGTNNKAGVLHKELIGNGLKVYTYKGIQREFNGAFLTGPRGSEMNIDPSVGGTPDQVYDGGDTVLWTPTTIVGNAASFDETSTAQARTGTQSLDATNSTNNETIQFAKGSTVTGANYTSVSGWIYITGWPTSGTKAVDIYCWDTGTNSIVGIEANIGDYVDTTLFNVWQSFNIPTADLNSNADFDAVRITTIDIGGGAPPDYYIDDLQIEETGGPETYKFAPEPDKIYKVQDFYITMADAYVNAANSIPYNGFLAVPTLTTGIVIQRIRDGEVTYSATLKDFIDLISLPFEDVLDIGTDGTNTWFSVSLKMPVDFFLDGSTNDEFRIIISDDLSGLLYFKTSLSYSEQTSIE
jgi:hypothetical protein